ncbi:MAG: putative baseplate assembly protein [Desulfosarcinaceae bacterium]|nr:putative baseplate assembly protein [Desulfosarcinaceae bacterium]
MNPTTTHPPDCGCCEGLTYRTPVAPAIRPGLSAISHRVGTHDHFLYSLLTGMAQNDSLSRLRTRERSDPTIALCDAVATLLDVLSFYQERFLNEAYLRTATETFSLHQLARQIAYIPAPAVAAATYLAFTAEAIPGGDVDIHIPAGTRVQSVPGQDEVPQIFETDEAITARVAWNALRPRQTIPYPPDEGASDIYVAGSDTGLREGDRLLFVSPERRDDKTSDQWLLATVRKVDPDHGHSRSHVSFDPPLAAPLAQAGFELYGMQAKAAIYGHNAAEWRTLPETTMKSYLALNENADLHESEKEEWPDYTIFAPHPSQHAAINLPPIERRATLDAVHQVTLETMATSSKGSIRQLTGAGPTAITEQLELFNSLASLAKVTVETSVPALGGALKESITNVGNSITGALEAFQTIATNLGSPPSTEDEEEDDDADAPPPVIPIPDFIGGLVTVFADAIKGPLETLKTELEDLTENNPLSALLETIVTSAGDDAPNDLGPVFDALSELGTAADEAVTAVADLPKAFEAAAATQLMAAVVTATVSFLRSQAEAIQLTPTHLAMAAMAAARLTEYYLEYNDPNFNKWIPEPIPGEDDENPILDLVLKGPEGLRSKIIEDLDIQEPVILPDTNEENPFEAHFFRPVRQMFQGLESFQVLLKPLLEIWAGIDDDVDRAKKFLESGLSRGARATRQNLAAHLAKTLKPYNEPQPERRPFPAPLKNQIDLERPYPEIFAGSDGWTVLSADGDRRLYQITAVAEAARSDYLLNAKTTRLTLEGPDLETLFEGKVRQTLVHAGSRLLTVVEGPLTTPVAGDRIQMEAMAPENNFIPPRKVALSGEATESGAMQSEIAEVIAMTDANPPTWYLAADLRHSYRRDSVNINANVAAASHGESQVEILGDGDGGSAFQSFILKQRPLTHKPGQGDKRFESTLSLRVNDIEWLAVPHFLESGPEDEAYTTHIDEEETATISFGDGRTGRRLPTGTNNVVARYRKGAGLGGNLRAHQLTTLASRPLGVGAVDNPAPASGGADGETLADLRQNLPQALLTFDRIVSLGDFEAYAAAYPGIGKAHATWVWDGVRRRVHVSVVAADGTAVDAASPLMENLKRMMDRVRDPQQPLTIASSAPVDFYLTAKLLIAPGHDFEVVAPAVVDALTTAFNFNAARYNQGVRRSVVIAAIQAVSGIAAVDLDLLAREDGLQTARGDLPVRPVARRDGSLQPAELLVINPERIVVSRMTVQQGG